MCYKGSRIYGGREINVVNHILGELLETKMNTLTELLTGKT